MPDDLHRLFHWRNMVRNSSWVASMVNVPSWVTEQSVKKPMPLPVMRRQAMSRAQFRRFLAKVPIQLAIQQPKGRW